MDTSSRNLLFHGVVVLLVGLLAGIPYGTAIKAGAEEPIRAWKLAHGSLPMGATTMIAVAAVLPHLGAGVRLRWSIVVSWALSGYGFCVALPVAAWTGARGLSWSGPAWNRFVYSGNVVGAMGSLVGALLLLYAVGCSLVRPTA